MLVGDDGVGEDYIVETVEQLIDDYEELIDYEYQNTNLDDYTARFGELSGNIVLAIIEIAEDINGKELEL